MEPAVDAQAVADEEAPVAREVGMKGESEQSAFAIEVNLSVALLYEWEDF